ncbi:MAG: hypothetical protein BMS9Abin02_2007 [Anaerolineae bacterium]|nr:MAG: hypothetical protein BMS9Abin02_2007 [Anaerolineae bacterium]
MDSKKLTRLKEKGIVPTTVGEFLGLSPSEVALIDLKLYFAKFVKEVRKERAVTQARLAQSMGSSQSRVAKIENGDPAVSLDLIFRALLALEVPLSRIARIIEAFEPPDYIGPSTLNLVTESQMKHTAVNALRPQLKDKVDLR